MRLRPSFFFFPPMDVQLLQHYLLKKLSFLHWSALNLCQNPLGVLVWVQFQISYSAPLIFVSLPLPIPNSLDSCSYSSSWNQVEQFPLRYSSSIKNVLTILNLRKSLLPKILDYSCLCLQKHVGILIGMVSNLYINLGIIDIFTMLRLPTPERDLSLHFKRFSLISSITIL